MSAATCKASSHNPTWHPPLFNEQKELHSLINRQKTGALTDKLTCLPPGEIHLLKAVNESNVVESL